MAAKLAMQTAGKVFTRHALLSRKWDHRRVRKAMAIHAHGTAIPHIFAFNGLDPREEDGAQHADVDFAGLKHGEKGNHSTMILQCVGGAESSCIRQVKCVGEWNLIHLYWEVGWDNDQK